MKSSIIVAILASCLATGVARSADPVRFEFLPNEYCTLQWITYEAGYYQSEGTCELTTISYPDYPNVDRHWGAAGTYDPSTREANETFNVGNNIDDNYYYGGISSKMSCDKDPWLDSVPNCRVLKVSTSGNVPRDEADSFLRKRGRPLTSNLTPGQRATLQQEYHARHYEGKATPAQAAQAQRVIPSNQTPQYHGNATPGQAAQVEGVIPRLADTDTLSPPLIPIPTTPLSGHAQKQTDNRRTAVAPQSIEIVEPAPGSQQSRGNVRIRVRGGSYAANPNEAMIVELSALPPRPTQPGSPSRPPAQGSRTTKMSLAQLQQGVVLPLDVMSAWTGPTLVRVRAAQGGDWSNSVTFDLIAGNAGVSARPALPAWSALQSTPASPAAHPVVVAPSGAQSPAPSLVPHSSLGGGH